MRSIHCDFNLISEINGVELFFSSIIYKKTLNIETFV